MEWLRSSLRGCIGEKNTRHSMDRFDLVLTIGTAVAITGILIIALPTYFLLWTTPTSFSR